MKKNPNEETYYTENPTSASSPHEWEFYLLGNKLKFTSDAGVFSKNTVDFGSRLLIDNFDNKEVPSGPILDLGTGYGPIGLAFAKAFNCQLEMTDINLRALKLAKQNAANNNIKNVKIYQSNLFEKVKKNDFAAIVTNPPVRAGKNIVHAIFTESFNHLQNQGTLTVVLQKKQGAPSAKKKMAEIFGNVKIIARSKGYYILKSYHY